jgi:DNA polymerase-3 subunit alpha
MGKKIKAEMAAQRGRFLGGAVERGVDKATADTIFDACAKFAEYGFNKSHSAPYAFITYQTAYMKANHPVEFLAASMTLDMGNTDKLAEFRSEAQRLGIKVQPPSVNRSGVDFDVAGHAIHYALAALKGVGRTAVEAIVAARGGRGFTDFSDFARRINPRLVNKRVLESLAAAGAFDDLERDRARAVAAMDAVLATAQRTFEAEALGQSELFGGPAAPEKLVLPDVATWLPAERLQREYDAIGFFLSGHPLDDTPACSRHVRAVWAVLAPGEVRRDGWQGRRHRGDAGGTAHHPATRWDHRAVGSVRAPRGRDLRGRLQQFPRSREPGRRYRWS